MDLTPPQRRSVKQLITAIDKAAQAEADAYWPGANLTLFNQFIQGKHHMFWHYRWGMGTGGFQAETGGYADIASVLPTIYATLYRNMMGYDVSQHQDVAALMMRQLVQSTLVDATKQRSRTIKLSSSAGISSAWFAYNFPIIPQSYQPMILTAWNHLGRVTDSDNLTGLFHHRGRLIDSPLAQAMIFINYPTTMTPASLDDLPLRWDSEFGHYSFRDGWQGDHRDSILQVYAKSLKVRGWNHPNAGTFRLFALGKNWVQGSDDRVGFRPHEPCVLLPLNRNINQGSLYPVGKGSKPIGKGSGLGQVEFVESYPDGSARITVNLDDIYASTKVDVTPKGHKQRMAYDNNLIRLPENLADSGINGKRAWGVDYRGVSGAPVTMILVDEIHGGDTRAWQWPYPTGKKMA